MKTIAQVKTLTAAKNAIAEIDSEIEKIVAAMQAGNKSLFLESQLETRLNARSEICKEWQL